MENASDETCIHNYFSRKEHVVFVVVNMGGYIVAHSQAARVVELLRVAFTYFL